MHRKRVAAAVIMACLTALTACSNSGSNSGGTEAGSRPADMKKVEANLAKWSDLPTAISQTQPLTKTPPKGVKIAYLNCGVPACAITGNAFKSAANALGWEPTVIAYDAATPGAAFQKAINSGNKYVILNSIPLSTVRSQMAEAKKKGIVVIGTYMNDPATGPDGNGLYANFQTPASNREQGQFLADWTIKDSGGKAQVLMATVTTLPALANVQKGAEEEYARNCGGCSMGTLGLSIAQVGSGEAITSIINYLRTHPDTHYLVLALGDLFNGLVPALKTAGLADKVKILGTSEQAPQLKSLIDGTSSAWTAVPVTVPWYAVDYAARHSIGEAQTGAQLIKAETVHSGFISSADVAKQVLNGPGKGQWLGPDGYPDQFKKLWGVN